MKKFIKRLRVASISLGIIAACGLIYDLVLFSYLRPMVLNFEVIGSQMETLGDLTALSLVLIGFFHLCTVVTLLLQITVQRSAGWLKVLTGVIGVISGLLLLSDVALLGDIGKEYKQGWDTSGEWTILFINHGLHILFTVLAFLSLMGRSKKEGLEEEFAAKDDVLFATAHTTGLLCGVIGLSTILLGLVSHLPLWVVEAVSIPIGLLILLPYLLILGTWSFMKRKEKIKEWFDEKQFQDISRAGLWTLILTLPCMIAMSILQRVNGPGSIYDFIWLPSYIFTGMTAFSLATLFSTRR